MIVCADDFGMAPDIDEAIHELACMGRLSAVSCMMASPGFDEGRFVRLLRERGRIDVGLHFMLTEGRPMATHPPGAGFVAADGTFPGHGALLRTSLAGRIDPVTVERELAAQHARFCELAGSAPDFVDGHMHVQQLPGVRDGVLGFLGRLPVAARPYVRNSAPTWRGVFLGRVAVLKTLAIGSMGIGFRRRAWRSGLRTNDGFTGIYDFRDCDAFPAFLGRFARHATGRTILMVHPGKVERWRGIEHRTLREAAWLSGRARRFGTNESSP